MMERRQHFSRRPVFHDLSILHDGNGIGDPRNVDLLVDNMQSEEAAGMSSRSTR